MTVSYKLVKRKNPQKKGDPAKWYATPNSSRPLPPKAMTRSATANTTLAPSELEAAMELLASFIPQQLQQGHTVSVPGLGNFRLTFRSKGASEINDFDPIRMIHSPRILFTPAAELKDRALRGLRFENGGVLENKVNYASLADYNKAKGLTGKPGTGDPGTGNPGAGGSGTGGDPNP
ncbi:hypothetical protein ETF27_05755 [Prevotella brunnea]|uniref:HU domain-containing protein n=1 Tax=Prevotella brunnea TaxID=2508867 RepID=A0A5C8GJL1_9BACT|nr:HU family DNA-binding protein [Prevotella brunnea]TXJ62177.1 hypothetical protein ETF27_05755 [Prevotella brunnea]